MADASQLNSWLLQNASALKLEVEHVTWISPFFPDLVDIATHFEVDGRVYTGWAHGPTGEVALAKSFAENVERVVMRENRFKTSNGLAAHLVEELAIEGAVNELVERDLFLGHFFSKTPYTSSSADLTLIEPLSRWLANQGIKISFFDLGRRGQVCLIDGRKSARPFGFAIGAAIKGTVQDSLVSAAIEAARRVHHALMKAANGNIHHITLDAFCRLQEPSFGDHGDLALDVDYANQIAFLFEERLSSVKLDQEITGITTSIWKPSCPIFKGCPLVVARASTDQVQDIFLGNTTPENINLARLSQLTGRTLCWNDINPLPHPFA